MAPRYSSSAAGAMRASLVLVLLLTAVAAAQADRTVSCENQSGVPMKVNGVVVDVGVVVHGIAVVDATVLVEFFDVHGTHYSESWGCPGGVSELLIVYVEGCVKLKVKAVLFGILNLLHKLLGSVPCQL